MPIVLALLLGVFTHIAWDSFTHADGWSVQHLSVLRSPVIQTSRGTIYLFKILQHISTILVAFLLAYQYFSWFKQTLAQPVELPVRLPERLKPRLILFMLLLAVISAGVYSYSVTSSSDEAGRIPLFVSNLVVVGAGVVMAELLIFSSIWHFKALSKKHGK